ncbi:helix-turn-helix domain-containing protein [Acidovorax sp. Leaf78]|uniref:helix-turn-helix domain-containing protein n=1 Tax=Acidovorax sp. Leaf78 TaxID=1736237 RepID=UPI00138EE66E|nr:helix-turn-helix transcriptional regulator [Acidovorax sp. Leaf78]
MSLDKSAAPTEKLVLYPELVQAREKLGLTQAQLASESGVSLSAIKSYEIGRTFPGAREIRQLCKVLKLTPNKLLFGVDDPFSSQQVGDAARFPGLTPTEVHRWRMRFLIDHLSAEECASFYFLMSALVRSRRGANDLDATEEEADLFAGVELLGKGQTDIELFRVITKDPEKARQVSDALKAAAAQAKSVN